MRTTSLTAVLAITLTVATAAAAGTPINEKRPATPGGTVEIDNLAGSVTVTGWAASELEVTGTLGKGVERLEITGSGSSLRVAVVLPDNARNVGDSDLVVKLPSSSRLDVDTVSATIAVSGVSGRLELESVSGTVTVGGQPSGLEVETVSGDIAVESAPSGSELESVSGRVTVTRADGELEAASVSGKITVSGGTLGKADLATTSGDIECTVDLAGSGTVDIESMSGSVRLTVPADVKASFELSTFSGSLESALGPKPQRTGKHTPGEELVFSLGAGPTVRAESFSGSVTVATR